MISANILPLFTTLSQSAAASPSSGFDFSIWKLVIVVGVGGVIVFYVVKRFADVWNRHKTAALIAQVEEPEPTAAPVDTSPVVAAPPESTDAVSEKPNPE